MCVRARRCLSSSTESARSPPQRLYILASLYDKVGGDFAPPLTFVCVIVKFIAVKAVIHPPSMNRADSVMSAQVRSGVGVTWLNNTDDERQ